MEIQEIKKNNSPVKVETILDNKDEKSNLKHFNFSSAVTLTPMEKKSQKTLHNSIQNSSQIISNGVKMMKTIVPNQNSTREYVIPLKSSCDDEEVKKPNGISTKRRKSATTMTIIHKNQKINEKKEIEETFPISVLAKRRASVPNPSEVSNIIDDEKNSNRELPTRKFQCLKCEETLPTLEMLKIHEENEHLRIKTNPSSTRTINQFKCVDCGNFFASYYFVRRHRTTCSSTFKRKCTFQYCRYRATTIEEITKHFEMFHANKFKCKVCKDIFTTQAQLIAHQVIKHDMKEEEGKKKRGRKRKDNSFKNIKIDLKDISIPC